MRGLLATSGRQYPSRVRSVRMPAVLIAAVAATGALVLPARASTSRPGVATPRPFTVIALPADQARVLIRDLHGAVGLGVFPDSRSAGDFWKEVSAGAPRTTGGVRSPLGGVDCELVR